MNKWLRRHKQKVLVIGGSLLMITFLMQSAGNRMARGQRNKTVARTSAGSISMLELNKAERELSALRDFNPILIGRTLAIEDGAHWYLLRTEAKQQGFVGGPLDGQSWIPELAPSVAYAELVREYTQQFGNFAAQIAQMTANDPQQFGPRVAAAEQMLQKLRTIAADRHQLTEAEFDQALASTRGITRMIGSFARAARLSDRRAMTLAKEREDATVVDYILIPADRITAESAEPTEAQLIELFEKYKDTAPADGDFGIGYRQSPRVKLAWLTLDKPAITAKIIPDGVEARKRHLRDRTTYPGEFDIERPRIEQQIREESAAAIMSEADRIIRAEILRITRKLGADGVYKALPPDWDTARPRLETIAQAVVDGVKSATGLTIDIPAVTVRDGEFTTLAKLQTIPGIGESSARLGGREIPFSFLVSAVRELAGDNDFLIQSNLPYLDAPLTDEQGRLYFFTILEARKESAADSLDTVRADVVKDFKKLQAYEKLKAESGQYIAIATESLDALVNLFHIPPPPEGSTEEKVEDLKIQKNIRVYKDRVGSSDQTLNVPEFRDAVRAAAAGLDPLTPADQLDPVKYTLAVPTPKSTSLALARIIASRPLTAERFRQIPDRALDEMSQTELIEAIQPTPDSFPFGRAALIRRHNFEYVGREKEETPKPEEPPAATTTSTTPAEPAAK